MLDQLPSEILTDIALHLSVSTLLPPLPLLLTCKAVHRAISRGDNPRLYARIFRVNFDLDAAERRIGKASLDQLDEDEDEDDRPVVLGLDGRPVIGRYGIDARDLAAELEGRVRALFRLRAMVERGNVKEVKEEDLWVVYLMLIENGKLSAEAR